MAKPAPYSYSDAGFNGFFRRTLVSSPTINALSQAPASSSRELNFDELRVSGSLGDTLQVGRVNLNGQDGYIGLTNELGEETGRIGNLDNLGQV